MLHRLACLRDDVVFFIYLAQMYWYKVDMDRANEFGVTGKQLADGCQEEKVAASEKQVEKDGIVSEDESDGFSEIN